MMAFEIWFLQVLIFQLVIVSQASFSSSHYSRDKVYDHDDECAPPRVSCVRNEDCERACPPKFEAVNENGACYFVSKDPGNTARTQKEARNFCEDLGATLLWLEDSKELPQLKEAFPGANLEYFLNAEYSNEDSHWVWMNTDKKINWKVLLQDFDNVDANINAVNSAALSSCFSVNLAAGTITARVCTQMNHFICKMGKARDDCSDSRKSRCCFSPSYSYYIRKQPHGYDPNLEIGLKNCKFRVAGDLVKCDEVLDTVKAADPTDSLTRIESSYYHFVEANHDCLIREAVISNEDVHRFVMTFIATQEADFDGVNVKIGLTFKVADDRGKWSNGKYSDYYETFWASGEPIRNDVVDGGCAAYQLIRGSSVVLWKFNQKADCDTFMKICELPIFRPPITKIDKDVQTCGKRRERGVLAKSAYSTYDENEANMGEFPWHAAIFAHERTGSNDKKFLCSGVLIDKNFILTSAHCVALKEAKDLLVALGEHDLESKGLLEPVYVEVSEIVVNHGFNLRHESRDDIALLQLSDEVDIGKFPHIGLACLPSAHELQSHGGGWECFSVGWQRHGYSKVLNRLPMNFTSEEFCRYANREYYASYRDRSYSHDYKDLKKHGYLSSDAELLCTESDEGCVDDPTNILVCKKKTYIRGPIFSSHNPYRKPGFIPISTPEVYITESSNEYKQARETIEFLGSKKNTKDRYRRSTEPYKPEPYKQEKVEAYKDSKSKNNLQKDSTRHRGLQYRPQPQLDYVINSYGADRFDADRWFVIGIGNALSRCGRQTSHGYKHETNKYSRYENEKHLSRRHGGNVQVYTSVHDYLSFIHFIKDLYNY